MKISVKNIMCDVKTINNVMYISDADCNRILYPKTKSISRGKVMSKAKLVNIDRDLMIKINEVMYYPLNKQYIDSCYHNQMMGF